MINTIDLEDSYQELLNTPQWRAKRELILARDNYTCRDCGSKENLHCHHILYANGLLPWEYPDEIFKTLCKQCHDKFHEKHTNTWLYRFSELINPTPPDPDNDPLD